MKLILTKRATSATAPATYLNTTTTTTDAHAATVKAGYKNDHPLNRLRRRLRTPNARSLRNNRHTEQGTSNLPIGTQCPSHHLYAGADMTPEFIVWLDHQEPYNDNVWWSPDDHKEIDGPVRVYTVGYILKETDDWLAVVGQITEDRYTSQPLVLVKSCIISRTKLRQGFLKDELS